jgi:hypothetical protein
MNVGEILMPMSRGLWHSAVRNNKNVFKNSEGKETIMKGLTGGRFERRRDPFKVFFRRRSR